MARAAKPVPEGYHTVTPQLTLDNAAQSIDWYKKALGAEEVSRSLGPDGKIMHAEIRIGDSRIMVNDVMMGERAQGLRRIAGVVLAIRRQLRRAVQPRGQGRRHCADAARGPVLGRPGWLGGGSGRLYVVDCHPQGRPDGG